MRLLGALRPLGTTWSGQVMSSRPAPSGGPFMTHLLPGGGVPRVHGARSPVPPRLPHFASPRSVRHLGTVVAGAYPPHRPSNTWSPGVPAPPGPCYWLVGSRTSTGWRGGCLAAGLVRSTVCYYCLGGCSALVVCAPRLRQVRGVAAGADSHVSPLPPQPSPALLAVRVAGRPVRVSLPFACRYAIPCNLCVPRGSVRLPFRIRASCPLRVCALLLPRLTPPPPGQCGTRTTLAYCAGRS